MIVIDEAHQHTVQTDLLLGLLKLRLSTTRSTDLKVVIMSATLDAKLFNDFFPGSTVELVDGRQYQVLEDFLAQPPRDVLVMAASTAVQCALSKRLGNILIFAPGVPEIHKILAAISQRLGDITEGDISPIDCYALHGKMSKEEQDNVVDAPPPSRLGKVGRKVIVATNVAEASITINDVTIVIDTGLAKTEVYDADDECWRFITTPISQAQKRQRVGRAGRQKEGLAYLMYTEGGFHRDMLEHPVASILEGDMVSECLTILALGESPLTFPYITPPSTETINKALAILRHLSAVTDSGVLTARGLALSIIPLDPQLAEVLLRSPEFNCSDEIISIISMMEDSECGTILQVTDTQEQKNVAPTKLRPLRHPRGDHLTLLNIYMAWRRECARGTEADFCATYALRMSTLYAADRNRREMLKGFKSKLELVSQDRKDPEYYINIVKALAAGNFLKVAMREGKSKTVYRTLRAGQKAELYKHTKLGGSLADSEFVLYNKHVRKDGQPDRLQLVTSVRSEWLISTRPQYWSDTDSLTPGEARERMVAVIAGKTGLSQEYIQGGMPAAPKPKATAGVAK